MNAEHAKPYDTANSNVHDRAAIVNANHVVCSFMMPVSPEHATVLYDMFGAKQVHEHEKIPGDVCVIFGMEAHVEYIRGFCKKAMETVEENLDKSPDESAVALGDKLGLNKP